VGGDTMVNKILVVRNETQIVISNNGKRFVVDKENKTFDLLKDKSNDEIKDWYLQRLH
jgi:hypothetical protein